MSFLEERIKNQKSTSNKVGAHQQGASFLDSRIQAAKQQQREKIEVAKQTMPSLVQMNQRFNKAMSEVAPQQTQTLTPQQQWVEDRLAKDREQSSGNKVAAAINKFLEPVSKKVYQAVSWSPIASFQKGAGQALGIEADTAPVKDNLGSNIANMVGQAAGAFTSPIGAQGLGQSVLNMGKQAAQGAAKSIPVLNNRLAQSAIAGGTAGALEGAYATGLQGGDAKDLAINTGLGLGLGSLADVAADGISRALSSRLRQNNIPDDEIQKILAPPEPKTTLAIPTPRPPQTKIIEEITNNPTTARIGRLENPYRTQFETLINEARQRQFRPGYEMEELDNLWSTMAGPEGVSLDELIQLAYPTRQSKLSPDLVKQAKEYQQSRLVAGVNLPIRTADERINITRREVPIQEQLIPEPAKVETPTVPEVKPQEFETPIVNLPEANQQAGISLFGKQGKFTNPEDTRTYIRSRTEREPIDAASVVETTYAKMFDDIQRLNTMDKELEKTLGRKLKPEERAYYKALNSRGADMVSNHILTERMVDIDGNVVGQSLKSIISQIPSGKANYVNFTDYLIAKHAVTRMSRGERVYNKATNMTVEKAQSKVDQYESSYPQFAKVADDLYKWNHQMAKTWLVDTGIIKPETLDAWLEQNPYWVPNKRFFSQLEKRGKGNAAKRSYSDQNNPVKSYSETGSERDIYDPIESIIEYTDKYVKTAKRNEVMQTLYRNLEKDGSLEGWATIIKREPVKADNDLADGLLTSLDEEMELARWRKGDKDKDNVVSVLVDGERVYMRVEDPELLDAISNIDSQGRNAVIEASRKLTNAFKNLTTGINPVFGLTRNIFRDIPEGYIFSQTTDNPFKYAWDVLDGFVSVFADGAYQGIDNSRRLQKVTPDIFRRFLADRAKLYKDYKAVGGGHSSPVAADRNMLKQSKTTLLPQNRSNPASKALGVLENLNNALESGVRLGEFKRTRQQGGSNTEALFKAQDVTTNFKRKGSIVRDLDAVVPYMNAAMQGLDKLGRTFKDRPVATVAKALGVISAPTIALYALNYDNPEYQKLSNYNKDNFYMIPNDDGTFTKIAKPRETGVMFSSLLERAMRAWHEEDPDAFKDFADTARTMFAPPLVGDLIEGKNPLRSTIFGPLVEVDANENFMGAPIVPQYLQGLSPELQYDANTSEVGKKIGDLLNVSPKQVDHLVRAYTGVIGQLGLPATTQGATVGDTLKKQMVVDPAVSSDATSHFYELKDKIQQQYDDARHTGEVPEGYNDDYRKAMNQVADRMSEYTKAIRQVDSLELTREEKKELKRVLTSERNDLARNAYQAVRDAIRSSNP